MNIREIAPGTNGTLQHYILRIFRNRNVEFIIAPYVAQAQVCYLQTLNIQEDIDLISHS